VVTNCTQKPAVLA